MTTGTIKAAEIELSLQDLEKSLGVKLTVIDRHGSFHDENGDPLLGKTRQSHQKNEVCRIGFCHACIMHCRHEMNGKGERQRKPFMHKCWKGVMELVVPLITPGMHYGTLFAGIWREDKKPGKLDAKLPGAFWDAWEKLPLIGTADVKTLANILTVYSRGMLCVLEEKNFIGGMIENRKGLIGNFIYAGASGKLRLEELARKLNLSASRTSHLVKSIFGKSFQELLVEERIKRAKTLLLSSDCTSGEISGMAGFSDEYHFSRTFKRFCGLTPGKYRKSSKIRKHP